MRTTQVNPAEEPFAMLSGKRQPPKKTNAFERKLLGACCPRFPLYTFIGFISKKEILPSPPKNITPLERNSRYNKYVTRRSCLHEQSEPALDHALGVSFSLLVGLPGLGLLAQHPLGCFRATGQNQAWLYVEPVGFDRQQEAARHGPSALNRAQETGPRRSWCFGKGAWPLSPPFFPDFDLGEKLDQTKQQPSTRRLDQKSNNASPDRLIHLLTMRQGPRTHQTSPSKGFAWAFRLAGFWVRNPTRSYRRLIDFKESGLLPSRPTWKPPETWFQFRGNKFHASEGLQTIPRLACYTSLQTSVKGRSITVTRNIRAAAFALASPHAKVKLCLN